MRLSVLTLFSISKPVWPGPPPKPTRQPAQKWGGKVNGAVRFRPSPLFRRPFDQGNEADLAQAFALKAAVRLARVAVQHLHRSAADRRDQDAARLELLQQFRRLMRRRGRDHDAVERRLFRPALPAVAVAGEDIIDPQYFQPVLGLG